MNWIRETLSAHASRTVCIDGSRRYRFADLITAMDANRARMPAGGRRVIEVDCSNTFQCLAELLAIAELGHIALPLPPELDDAQQTSLREITRNSPLYGKLDGDSGLILFSSGTTGAPKAMLHNFKALLERYRDLKCRSDHSLLLLLLDHIGGLDSAFRCVFAGSTLVLPESRSPNAAGAAIEAHRVNVLPASPTFLNLMLLARTHETHDLSSLTVIAYGAEPMPAALLRRLAKVFPQARLQQKFGTSETGAIRIQSAASESLFFRIVDPDTDWKIIDGELWLKTPSRIIGYLNDCDDPLEADGWYRTGDLVESDPVGGLRIIGRLHEVFNVGGQKVHPGEITSCLEEMEDVEAASVYSEPDPITGQRICARIVSTKEESANTWKRRIRRHCRGRIASWKIPSRITVSTGLDMTSRLKRSGL